MLLLVMLFLPAVFSFAQKPQLKEARTLNLALLRALDEYERVISFSGPNDKRAFLGLFWTPDSPCVYNDVLGTPDFQEMISPRQYVEDIPEDGTVLFSSTISNVRKDSDPYFLDGLLHRKVSLEKYIMIIDSSVYTEGEGGVLFDSSQIFARDPDFKLVLDFVYVPEQNRCYIYTIESLIKKEASPLDEDNFSIVLGSSSRKNDSHLTSRGEYLTFNEFNQSLAYRDEIDIDNPNMRLKVSEEAKGNRYNIIGVKSSPIILRTKLYFDYLAGNALDIKSSSASISGKASGYRFGVDLGVELPVSNSWAFGLYSGAGLAFNDITFSTGVLDYTLNYTNPERSYRFSCIETEKLQDIVVPAYLGNEFILAKFLTLCIDAGARLYINRSTELSPLEVSGIVGGVNMNPGIQYTQFVDPAEYTRAPYDIALFGRGGLDLCLVKKLLYLYVAYDFEWGLNSSYDSSRDFFNATSQVYPIYYSPIKGEDVPFRSLIGSVSYRRRASTISGGIKIKF